MGLIKTISNFCYIECDMSNCNRKMEHIDEAILKQLAALCNWENQDGQWMCPDCLSKIGLKTKTKAKVKVPVKAKRSKRASSKAP